MNRLFSLSARLLIGVAVTISCTREEPESVFKPSSQTLPSLSPKILGTASEDVVPDELILRIPRAEHALGALETVRRLEGVRGLRPLFSHFPGEEEAERRFGLDEWFVASLDGTVSLQGMAVSAAALPQVRTVEFNRIARRDAREEVIPLRSAPSTRAEALPFNDPMLDLQWHYINTGDLRFGPRTRAGADIQVKEAWKLCTGDPSIIVAVLDEGIKYTHPDLAANMWVNTVERDGAPGVDDDHNGYVDDVYGYNFYEGGAINWGAHPKDSGHGTHCAGTIAAVNHNGIGVSGVAGGSGQGDGVRLMSCQTMVNGGAPNTATTAAIQYAAAMGASVISRSFGTEGSGSWTDAYFEKNYAYEKAALDYFESKKNNPVLPGGVAVFSSGNEGKAAASYPGAYHAYICVSAFAPDFLPACYTNYSNGCSVCAPGGEYAMDGMKSDFERGMILSTLVSECAYFGGAGVDYGYMQGTSMACPHVSGIVALALSYAKKLGRTFSLDEFKSMLITSTNEMDSRLIGERKYWDGTWKTINLGQYRKKLGSGAIDTWKLFMQIEGTPCLLAKTGENQRLDLKEYFGGGASDFVTYLGVSISAEDKAALGLNSDPVIEYGKLKICPNKVGSGKITVRAIGAGDVLGGGESHGGMEISKTISVISRPVSSKNNGWL